MTVATGLSKRPAALSRARIQSLVQPPDHSDLRALTGARQVRLAASLRPRLLDLLEFCFDLPLYTRVPPVGSDFRSSRSHCSLSWRISMIELQEHQDAGSDEFRAESARLL